MTQSRLHIRILRLLRNAAQGHGFLAVCLTLSLCGTLSAAYPVTAIVVPAALLVPRRWLPMAIAAALGSAIGATLLVAAFHHLGWNLLYEYFPDLATNESWHRTMSWVSSYGTLALFMIAATPLPQTPALIFFGITSHDFADVLFAMLAGKLIKYGLFAWVAAKFPDRFAGRLGAIFGVKEDVAATRHPN